MTFSFNNNARIFSREFFNTQLVVVFIIDIFTKVGKRNDACYARMKSSNLLKPKNIYDFAFLLTFD